ncbi:MAG TPA: AMP-binding protein [Caulobacteraceae bacterium]|nr:AMP-binding protein [Caulobacteraceae bacterium]
MFVLRKIQETAVADPAKLALVHNRRPIAYSEFWRLIEGCRRALQPLLPDHGVAVLSVDSILEGWILSLAVRALGLDAAVTRTGEQAELFEGFDVACVISLISEHRGPVATPTGAKAFRISDPSRQSFPDGEAPPPLPEPLLAGGQILLTSGTTGVSKKALIRSGSIAQPILDRARRYRDLGEKYRQQGPDTVLNIFGLGLWTGAGHLWPIFTWCHGGGVVIHEGQDLERSFDWPGITHSLATPAFLSALMAAPEGAFAYQPQMQLNVVSGALTPALARETRRRLTPRILVNLSSTEGGGWARTLIETDEDLRWYRLDPTRTVEVVDDAGNPLPRGELGRVRIDQRPDAPTGYLGDPDATAKFFSDGWFYPGDLGVLDGKGRLALHGRSTDIVHIRGSKFPAEPWERTIQETLECEGVCILSGSWRSEAEQLHLFIESRRPIPGPRLAEAVRATLSGFPGVHVHLVEALPRTPTGKIRRITLAQQLHEGVYGEEA